jgi:CTP:molybdopterin cytidylyltransferase MocA
MKKVAAIIIAAGSSSRLGRPKQLVLFAGETLLARAIRVARESGVEPLFVVLGANREEIEAGVDLSRAQIVLNRNWKEGMASSIRAGIDAVEKDTAEVDGVLLMVCDQPLVTEEHLRRMLAAFRQSGTSSIASLYSGKRGIPAIFPRQSFAELAALKGDQGARSLLSDAQREVIEAALEGGEVDVDRAEDVLKLGSL